MAPSKKKTKSRNYAEPLYGGPEAIVFWNGCLEKMKKDKKVQTKDLQKVMSTMSRMYCRHGPANIPVERLNNEGRHKVGHQRVGVMAFKSFQLRVYGAQGSVNGQRAFFATEYDVKKENEANPAKLVSAAQKAVEFTRDIPGAEL